MQPLISATTLLAFTFAVGFVSSANNDEQECALSALTNANDENTRGVPPCDIMKSLGKALDKCPSTCGLVNYLKKKVSEGEAYSCGTEPLPIKLTTEEVCVDRVVDFVEEKINRTSGNISCNNAEEALHSMSLCPKGCLRDFFEADIRELAALCKKRHYNVNMADARPPNCQEKCALAFGICMGGASTCWLLPPTCLVTYTACAATEALCAGTCAFRSCCEENGVDASLLPLCNYTLMLAGQKFLSTGSQLDISKPPTNLPTAAIVPKLDPAFVKCYTKEKDVRACCREAGVQQECLPVCDGSAKTLATGFDHCLPNSSVFAHASSKALNCFARE